MADRPLLQRPTYLDVAPPEESIPALKAAAADACDCIREAPGAGLIGATMLGVTAAYFAPKFFDWALTRWRGYQDGQPDEFDLEEVDR